MFQRLFLPSLLIFTLLAPAGRLDAASEEVIATGKKVTVQYILTIDGEEVDNTYNREPLTYTQGDDKILPGLATKLEGMKAGDKQTILITADEGFGQPDEKALVPVPRDQLPPEALEPGMVLTVPTKTGQTIPAIIKSVSDTEVILDFNHPLAGKDLSFEIEVVEVA